MTDQELIEKVKERFLANDLYQLPSGYPLEYLVRVLIRYTRWIERAKQVKETKILLSQIKGTCVMAREEACFGGDWEAAHGQLDAAVITINLFLMEKGEM